MIKKQLEAYKAYCKVNNLNPSEYDNLKAYCKQALFEEVKTLCGIGSSFNYKTLIQLVKRGYKVSYSTLNNYPELNYYINDKIGVSVNSGVVSDVYYLYT